MTDRVEAIRAFVIQKIRTAAGEGHDVEDLQDDFSLVESGLFDSVGFVNLVAALETEFDIEIDFAEFDPEEFMTLGGIVQCSVQTISHSADPSGRPEA